MSTKLLLHLLSVPSRSRAPDGGFSIVAGIVIAMAIVVGGVALVELSTGRLQGVFASSDSRQARAAAEAGLDQIIGSWNQPENRKMLVSGTAMNTWASTTTGETLRSPCVSNSGTRPGSNSGQPTLQARSFGDGQFRDVGTGAVGSGERRFRLTNVTYSTGAPGSSNRRSLQRTTAVGSGSITAVGTPPTGNWDQLINLEDPDGASSLVPGDHHGFITLTVTGLVVRNGVVVGTSTVTREFEVLPKCCGASLGSNGSGGSALTGRSLGSDSRYCGLQWGIITGINGGTHWSYFANDRFTTRNSDGTVVNLSTMLGVLKPGETLFDRSNCRVIPAPNNSACNPSQSSTDRSYGSNFTGAVPQASCIQPSGSTAFFPGMVNDILGKSISCVPIIPITLSSLPRISDSSPGSGDGRYNFSWVSGSGPARRILANDYPSFSSSDSTYKYIIRTNSASNKVEVCEGTTTCTSGSWVDVSSDIPAGDIRDDFASAGYAGRTAGSDARWIGNWIENDAAGAAQSPSAGDVQIASNRIRLTDTSRNGGTVSRRAAISRGLNLSGLLNPVTLEFTFTQSGFSGSENLVVEARSSPSGTWVQLGATFNASGTYTRDLSPYASATTEIRFRVNADIGNSDFATIDNVSISSLAIDAWCAYTSSSPYSSAPGFHCLGPSVSLDNGAKWVIDTTGGPLSFYYTQPTDNRGLSVSSPLIEMNNGSALEHVFCSSLVNNCTTPVSDLVYSPVGEPDRLNFFGRDRGSSAVTQYLQVNSQFTSPVKISGVWFYFPEGDLTMDVNSCTATQPAGFYTNNDNWTFSGRVWIKNFKPCGPFHFRVPPSSLANATSLFGAINTPGDASFVAWSGVDWVARATTNVKLF